MSGLVLARRNLFGLLAAPVIIKTAGILMPIKPLKNKTLLPMVVYSGKTLPHKVEFGSMFVTPITRKLYIYTADNGWIELVA